MPWGKYKGVDINNIPYGYIRWLFDQGYINKDSDPELLKLAEIKIQENVSKHTISSMDTISTHN
jgi:uncharacterized protein (DUF3820 family)